MPATKIPFSTQTYQHRSPNVQIQKTLNFYPEIDPNNVDNPILIGTPGTILLGPIPVGKENRGVHTTATGRVFGVFGGVLYEINSSGSIINQWQISDINTTISFADDGNYLLMADTKSLYCLRLSTNQFVNVDNQSDWQYPIQVEYLQGFFYLIDGTNRIYFSDINEGPLLWPGLNFAEAESSADPIIGFTKRGSDMIFFGPQSYEVWRLSGNADLPIVPVITSTTIGCAAASSIAVIQDNVFFMGSNTNGRGLIFKLAGNVAEPISNPAISFLIDKAGVNIQDSYACAYQQETHAFYCLSIPAIELTICYDLATNMWHERGSRDPNTNITRRWDVAHITYGFNRIICGNLRKNSPGFLQLSLDKYDEYDGRTIQRVIQSPIYNADGATLFFQCLELEMETGVGIANGQGSDPVAMLDYSNDCHSWTGSLFMNVGSIGEYWTRLAWNRLGSSRWRAFRITITDPIKCVIRNARLWVIEGRSR